MKVCSVCKTLKEEEFFYFRLDTKKLSNECKSCKSKRASKWNKQNKNKRAKILDKYNQLNKEKVSLSKKSYKIRNRRKLQDAENKRASVDIVFRLKRVLRSRLVKAVKGKFKAGSAVKDLGCSVSELRAHLESKFQPGMSWENYGRTGWHIDHIRPLSSFNLADSSQLKQACHYTNLQPLWASDNLAKGSKRVVK